MTIFRLPPIKTVSVALTTDEDIAAGIVAYDNTKLVAINTCPTWGILRYGMHKTMSGEGSRAMPLEMGSAAHEVFAAVRLWQLRAYQKQTVLSEFHGPRLFGAARFQAMLNSVDEREDERAQSLAFCLTALETSGFYDDPSDRRRTMTNLEEACIAYIDRWDWNRAPVWIRDPSDPCSDIGIELPFDVLITFTLEDGTVHKFRFIGKADGLHMTKELDEVILHENKTASRLDDAWRQSFHLNSQPTGYMIALGVWAEAPIRKGDIFGMSVPLPKNYDFGGLVREPVNRYSHHFERWFDWFLHTALLERSYADDPMAAPKYTHSCNRYFRPCSMIPFCDADDEEQRVILSEMREDEWTPLAEVYAGD